MMDRSKDSTALATPPRGHPAGQGKEMVHQLNRSFETFIEVAEELKSAYQRLQDRAASMDLQLKDANRSLSEKVQELDGMTRRLNGLLQSLPSAVVAVDAEGRVIHFNRTAEEMLGLEAREVLGGRPERIETLRGALLLCMPGDRWPAAGAEGERSVLVGEHRRLVVTSRIAELKDARGRYAGRIEILNDLTETDRLRREVHRLDTLAAMGEMAAAVAHQIRNPLNGVEGFASLLQRSLQQAEGNPEDRLRYAGHILEGVREVNAVINGMLLLARSDQLQVKPMNLNLLLLEVVQDLRRLAETAGIEGEIQFRPCPCDALIHADGLKLKQACLNLCHNALEALDGKPCRRVRVTAKQCGDHAEIRVADSGKGMDPATAGKVFRPFFTTREKGTGLGLAVAAKMVDLHGGRITFRSLSGVGTVFKIDLRGAAPGDWDGERHARPCARCR